MSELSTHPSALHAWRERRARTFRMLLAPPPRLTVSGWADRYRMLSREASAEPGKWRTDRAPYQRGILDAFSDPTIETVVMMSSAQVGKTEIVLNVVGYFVDQDPAPILCIQPTLEMGEAFSKDRLAPMARDTPRLAERFPDPRARDSGNTLRHKVFPGGHITISGANSAASLASRPIRILLCDEVDRFPHSAGTEGDPVDLGRKRTSTFWNRKVGLFSTPTIRGFSRIASAFEASDQRRYYVPCPECEESQTLVWANLRWEGGDPETAFYVCEHCGVVIDESRKPEMLRCGEWRAENPGSKVAGFHLNALYSPWARWPDLIREFLDAKGNPERLKVFVNTVLGETWEEEGDSISADSLEARMHDYGPRGTVPEGAGVLTAGVDVQGDRLELVVKAWGRGEESWLVEFRQLWGDPGREEVWRELDAALLARYPHAAGGTPLRIRAACIDTGGHHAEHVYRFCAPRQDRRVWASKGHSSPGRPIFGRPSRVNKFGARLVMVGTDTAKDLLFARLRIRTPSPGYLHFPKWLEPDPEDPERRADIDAAEYFAQLTAEKVVTRYVKGRPVRAYEKTRPRNEALDLEVLATAALVSLGPAVTRNLGALAERASGAAAEEPQGEGEEADAPTERPAATGKPRKFEKPKGGGWVGGWQK